jgi:hypothetical protein
MAANEFDRERKRRAADGPADARPGTPRVQSPPAEPVVMGRRPAGPTRRRNPLTWILPLLLLIALIPLLRRDRGPNDDQAAVAGDTLGATAAVAAGDIANAGAVARFASWAGQDAGGTASASSASHPYTAEGIRYLADALQEVATRRGGTPAAGTPGAAATTAGSGNASFDARIQRIRDRASQIEQTPPNGNTAEHANAAFGDAARLIGELRGARSMGTRASGDLTNAAQAVQSGRTLQQQGPQVRTFFQRAATALQGLSGETATGTGADTSRR